jgi:hypothetical protein
LRCGVVGAPEAQQQQQQQQQQHKQEHGCEDLTEVAPVVCVVV